MNAGAVRVSRAQQFAAAVLHCTLVAIAYFLAARLGFLLSSSTQQVTAVWPASGIALVALLRGRAGNWQGVLLGAFTVNVLNHETWSTALGIACGNTVGPACAAMLLVRVVGFDQRLACGRDVLALVGLGAVALALFTATNGVSWLALAGIVPWRRYFSVWWVWWVGDAIGALIVAPMLLTWLAQPRSRWPRERKIELAVLFVLLGCVSRVLFFSDLPLTYGVFPFAVWAALRFGQREAASTSFVIAVGAVWGAIHERGPFVSGPQQERLILLALFLGVMAITVLVFASTSDERRRALVELANARAALETRVAERTRELAQVNSDLQRANRELARRGQQVAAKNEELETFVYAVSHDLRAPLVNLHGFSSELQRSCQELTHKLDHAALPEAMAREVRAILVDGVEDALRYIMTSSHKLQSLIDSLLVLSRTGRARYSFEVLDVSRLVESTLDILRQAVAASGAQVTVGELPSASGDLTAVGQVFSNLIGNALKYLQPGRAGLIEIGGEREAEMCHYWVRDNGVGLAPSAQKRLFQAFARFHPQLASGEGMGLAIVKRVVERHGGKVWADSQEGEGTTFHLTLPRADAKESMSWRRTA
jgi:signal transduction histidine kinase